MYTSINEFVMPKIKRIINEMKLLCSFVRMYKVITVVIMDVISKYFLLNLFININKIKQPTVLPMNKIEPNVPISIVDIEK
jgi:hypothetical protein